MTLFASTTNAHLRKVSFFGWAISRYLSTTPHPIEGQGGNILLVHYSMIILKPAFLVFNGGSKVQSQSYLQLP